MYYCPVFFAPFSISRFSHVEVLNKGTSEGDID